MADYLDVVLSSTTATVVDDPSFDVMVENVGAFDALISAGQHVHTVKPCGPPLVLPNGIGSVTGSCSTAGKNTTVRVRRFFRGAAGWGEF